MLAGAGLMALTCLVHVFAGGPEVMEPLRASDVAAVPDAVLHVVWHMVTLMLAVMAGALAYLGHTRNGALAVTLIALNLGTAVIFVGYGALRLGTLAPMPQWTIFLVIAGVIAVGLRRA